MYAGFRPRSDWFLSDVICMSDRVMRSDVRARSDVFQKNPSGEGATRPVFLLARQSDVRGVYSTGNAARGIRHLSLVNPVANDQRKTGPTSWASLTWRHLAQEKN